MSNFVQADDLNNFLETLLLDTLEDSSSEFIRSYTKDIPSEQLQQAISGFLNVVKSRYFNALEEKQEAINQIVFNKAKGIILILFGKIQGTKFVNRLKGFKGIKRLTQMFGSDNNSIEYSKLAMSINSTEVGLGNNQKQAYLKMSEVEKIKFRNRDDKKTMIALNSSNQATKLKKETIVNNTELSSMRNALGYYDYEN